MVKHNTARTVLVVEDESLVRMHIADTFRDAGLDVIEAENSDEAIATLESRKDISLVFTDVQMPGSMDGLRLARVVKAYLPVQFAITA